MRNMSLRKFDTAIYYQTNHKCLVMIADRKYVLFHDPPIVSTTKSCDSEFIVLYLTVPLHSRVATMRSVSFETDA